MKDKTGCISTAELWARLFRSPTAEQYLRESSEDYTLPKFSAYITELCKVRNETPEKIINRAEIERSFGHHLFRGTRNPSRDTVLQLAFGFELSVDETQQLLKVARMTALHPKVKRDAVIAHCLYGNKGIVEAQHLLHEAELPLLGGAYR